MEYKHFSHEHTLNMYKVQEGQQFRCHGCQTMCYDSIYACWKCNFFLHEHCGNANRYVRHPAHPLHPLVLIPSPTYCSGSFLCNACGAPGSSFSYCCALCEVDLHLQCAFLPPEVNHKSHQHELVLGPTPDQKGSPEYCKICSKELSSKNWSYACDQTECDFRVHTFCATTEVKPGIYQDGPALEIPTASPESNVTGDQNASPPASNVNQPQPSRTAEEEFAAMLELQTQLQTAQALAQMMASINLSNLV